MDFLFPKKLFENKVLNAFYFMFKALFVLKISNFCWLFFGHAGKPIDKKTKVNFKILTSQTGEQIVTIHILPNISRSTDKQTMKFDQLIDWKFM